MHRDLSIIVNEDEPLYILTLQQEVLACSLDHCMTYYEQFNIIPQVAADMLFRECSIAMSELFPGYGGQAMQAMKPQYDDLVQNPLAAKLFVNNYYSQINNRRRKSSNAGAVKRTFCSSRHQRIENVSSPFPVEWDMSFVQRMITLNYTDNGNTLTVDIYPSLTAKRARLLCDCNNVLTYIGEDPCFEFEIETGPDNTIKRFSLFRKDKDLELRYFE